MVNIMPNDGWSLWRHSGFRNGKWREIKVKDQNDAEQKFKKIAEELRQGAVELRYKNIVQQSRTAPRLRTCW